MAGRERMGGLGERVGRARGRRVLVTAVALASAGCASGTAAAPRQTTVGSTTASTPSTGVVTSTAPATTTTQPTTTTTEKPAAASGSFTTTKGWRYSYTVEFGKPTMSHSESGCVPVAPPGRVNLPFVLKIHNDLQDREAPAPAIYVVSNLAADGTVLNPAPSNVLDVDNTGGVATAAPVELVWRSWPACLRLQPGSTYDTIDADRSITYRGMLGGATTTVSPDTALAFRVAPAIERQRTRTTGYMIDRFEDWRTATDGDWIARYAP